MNYKKTRMVMSVFIMCMMLVLIATGCNVTKKTSEDDGNELSSTFSADSGYSIDYPDSWTVSENESQSKVEIIAPVVSELGKSPQSLTITQEDTAQSIDLIFELFKSGLESAGADITTSTVTINEQVCRRADYTLSGGITGICIINVLSDVEYKLTFIGNTAYVSSDLIDSMIETFEFP
jgi:hypothetical protein